MALLNGIVMRGQRVVMGLYGDRFRVAAQECLEAARRTNDLDSRTKLLSMAQQWLELSTAFRHDRRMQPSRFDDVERNEQVYAPTELRARRRLENER
jgi:hypothetical protein